MSGNEGKGGMNDCVFSISGCPMPKSTHGRRDRGGESEEEEEEDGKMAYSLPSSLPPPPIEECACCFEM